MSFSLLLLGFRHYHAMHTSRDAPRERRKVQRVQGTLVIFDQSRHTKTLLYTMYEGNIHLASVHACIACVVGFDRKHARRAHRSRARGIYDHKKSCELRN